MMRAADEVIIVADSTKFGHASLAHLCQLGDVDTMVTDSDLSADWQERIGATGAKLVIAETSDQTQRHREHREEG